MSEQNDISKKLKKTLDDYGEILKKCTEAMETNSTKNKAKIGEIRELVKVIKGKVMGANENLKLINENREKFDKATKEKTEQLKEAVRRSQEENTKKMAELQNQQVEAKKAADKRIQEIESKSKSDLDETQRLLNEKHNKDLQDKIDALRASEESKTALEEKQKEAQIELERIKEVNRKQKEANDDDIRTRQNDLELVNKTLAENKQELERIMRETEDKDKKIEKLNQLIEKMNQEKEELNAQHATALTQLGEKNARLIEQNSQITKDLNTKHDKALVELNNKHEEAIKELQSKLAKEFEQQKKDAVEATVAMKDQEAELKVSASNGQIEIIEQRVQQCNADKERFNKQLLDAQKTIQDLKRDYNNQEEASLEQLKQEVDDVDNLLEKAVSTLKLSREIAGTDETLGEPVGTGNVLGSGSVIQQEPTGTGETVDDSGKKEVPTETGGQQEGEDIGDGWKKYIDKSSGKPYYHNETTKVTQWNDPHAKAKVDETSEELHIDPDGEGIKVKGENKQLDEVVTTITTTKSIMTIRDNLFAVLDKYIENINHEDTWKKLIERVINNHGVHNQLRENYLRAMPLSRKNDFQNFIGWYKIMLQNMLRQSKHYRSVTKEISGYGFENTFEQLLAAAHLLIHHDDVSAIYMNGDYWSDIGTAKLAIDMWDESSTHPTEQDMKNNARRLGLSASRRKIGRLHGYHHSSDHKAKKNNLVRPGYIGNQLGGFRHGKRSKKENRRSLKSKLKAKKYSLKSKKRGKNKSKKRRKSIKIRIK